MKTAAELWADTIKKQPIDDLTIKHTCESIEELINKKTTGVRLAGLLSRAEAMTVYAVVIAFYFGTQTQREQSATDGTQTTEEGK